VFPIAVCIVKSKQTNTGRKCGKPSSTNTRKLLHYTRNAHV